MSFASKSKTARFILALAVQLAASAAANAQQYPTRSIRMIVGYAAGGATDLSARDASLGLTGLARLRGFGEPQLERARAVAGAMRLSTTVLVPGLLVALAVLLRFRTLHGSVVALGLASGFMEPLESTSIHLIQSGISKLLELFPHAGISQVLVDRYYDQLAFEFDRIRDFLVLHYNATERDDTPFWNQCRTMSIPDELKSVVELFRDSGRFFRNGNEMFAEISWIQVMVGQGILPRAWHPLVDNVPDEELSRFIDSVGRTISNCVNAMPPHQAFIDRCCKASVPVAA